MDKEITYLETDKPHLAVFSVSCEAHDKHQKGQQQRNALVTALYGCLTVHTVHEAWVLMF